MIPSELQSDGNGGHNWKGSTQGFMGYTAAKLESLHEVTLEIKKECKTNNENFDKRLRKIETGIATAKGKASVYGGIVGFVVAAGFQLLMWLRGGG